MKYLFLILLIDCVNNQKQLTDKPIIEKKVVCEDVKVVLYDAFFGGCKESPCVHCVDTTHAYELQHRLAPVETVYTRYKVLEQ
jgi:hypothetical protein